MVVWKVEKTVAHLVLMLVDKKVYQMADHWAQRSADLMERRKVDQLVQHSVVLKDG